MNNLIHADIFFFISSIGFVIFFILLFTTLLYIIRLLKRVNSMAKKVEKNIGTISDEAKDMILDFRESAIVSLLFGRRKRRSTKAQ